MLEMPMQYNSEGNGLDLLADIQKKISGAEGVMVALTVLRVGVEADGERTLEHHLITRTFPPVDMLRSHRRIKELIIKELETGTGRGVS